MIKNSFLERSHHIRTRFPSATFQTLEENRPCFRNVVVTDDEPEGGGQTYALNAFVLDHNTVAEVLQFRGLSCVDKASLLATN